MATDKPAIFKIRNIEISYIAEFRIPIMEIVLPEIQIKFINFLCNEFNVKFADIIFNNQAISSRLINFRKQLSTPNAYFELTIGVDEIRTICMNPATEAEAWELTVKVVGFLGELVQLNFRKQTLSFNVHCSPENIKYSDYIRKINRFSQDNELIIARGATFSMHPSWNGQVHIIIDRSLLFDEGLFILMQAIFDESIQEYRDLFNKVLSYIKQTIEPIFKFKIEYDGRR